MPGKSGSDFFYQRQNDRRCGEPCVGWRVGYSEINTVNNNNLMWKINFKLLKYYKILSNENNLSRRAQYLNFHSNSRMNAQCEKRISKRKVKVKSRKLRVCTKLRYDPLWPKPNSTTPNYATFEWHLFNIFLFISSDWFM